MQRSAGCQAQHSQIRLDVVQAGQIRTSARLLSCSVDGMLLWAEFMKIPAVSVEWW
jgi:hypothetical protein